MSEEIRQELDEEIQEYKKMLHAQIDDMNDLNILKAIAYFIFKKSFSRKD
mgnify:CR=1 FL=1